MKWWTVLLGILLVFPLLGFLVLRGVHVFKVRRNRRRHPEYSVKEYSDFLTEAECEHLIETAAPRVRRGGASGDKSWMSQVQQSSTAFLQTDATIARIKQKLARLSGIPLDQQEKIQVTRYDRFEYYGPHFDSLGGSHEARQGPGNRICTILIYLNDDYEGGSTYFPEFGLRIEPERGKAVLFHNLTAEADAQHPMARHVGEPVLSGEKWICNQWIRQRTVAQPPAARASTRPPPSRDRSSRSNSRRKRKRR
jgi:prolyl 4-hydroxylase